MKEPSPLVPQGSFEAQAKRKSHVRIAVFSILAIHLVVLGGLLILGCKREDKDNTAQNPPTNDVPVFASNEVAMTNPPALPTNPIVAIPPIVPPTNPPSADAGAMTEYTIAKGDSFATIATKFGVTAKAIQDANPDKVPTKLKIGDKIKIPPKATAQARATTTAAPDTDGTYTVKSGDTLGKIATQYHTTVKKLQEMNNLSTTQIKVAQKLKVPPGAAATNTGAPPPAQ